MIKKVITTFCVILSLVGGICFAEDPPTTWEREAPVEVSHDVQPQTYLDIENGFRFVDIYIDSPDIENGTIIPRCFWLRSTGSYFNQPNIYAAPWYYVNCLKYSPQGFIYYPNKWTAKFTNISTKKYAGTVETIVKCTDSIGTSYKLTSTGGLYIFQPMDGLPKFGAITIGPVYELIENP